MSSEATTDKPGDKPTGTATVVIKGRSVELSEDDLTFDRVVELSGLPTGPNLVFTITYRRRPRAKAGGLDGRGRRAGQGEGRDDLQCQPD